MEMWVGEVLQAFSYNYYTYETEEFIISYHELEL
jgi:hypothetical protein